MSENIKPGINDLSSYTTVEIPSNNNLLRISQPDVFLRLDTNSGELCLTQNALADILINTSGETQISGSVILRHNSAARIRSHMSDCPVVLYDDTSVIIAGSSATSRIVVVDNGLVFSPFLMLLGGICERVTRVNPDGSSRPIPEEVQGVDFRDLPRKPSIGQIAAIHTRNFQSMVGACAYFRAEPLTPGNDTRMTWGFLGGHPVTD